MADAHETIKANLGEVPDEQVQASESALTIAPDQGSIAIAGNAAESVILAGNHNQVNHNQIHHGLGVEEIRAIVRELQALQIQPNSTNAKQSDSSFDNEPLVLSIEPQMIEHINSRLATIEELQQVGYISNPHHVEFHRLKERVYSFKEINQKLESLADDLDQMLENAVASLTDKLRNLDNSLSDSLLDARSQVCLKEQRELLIQFQEQLGNSKVVARWLNRERSQQLAQTLGQHALEAYPQIKDTVSPRRLEAFYFSIEQFLERLSHCLTWGRTSSLDNPVTPVVLDDAVYAAAFQQLKNLIPDHLPTDGIEQLKECIDYLIQNLPNYRHLLID